MESIGWDAVEGGYRIRFQVLNLQAGDEWSTVQTEPPLDIRSTRWIGETVEVMTPHPSPWRVNEGVLLTLKPYW